MKSQLVTVVGVAFVAAACGSPTLPIDSSLALETETTASGARPSVRVRPEARDGGSRNKREEEPEGGSTWHLVADGERVTMLLEVDGTGLWLTPTSKGQVEGFASTASTAWWRVTLPTGRLRFRVNRVGGVVAGRFVSGDTAAPFGPAWRGHVTGWQQEFFEETRARSFRLETALGELVSLRVDADDTGRTRVGQWKEVGSLAKGWLAEGPQLDLTVSEWDGERLSFETPEAPPRKCTGLVDGRALSGSCTRGAEVVAFTGERTELLGYGLLPKTAAQRQAWQAQTRAVLQLLVMDKNPAPRSVSAEAIGPPLSPFPTLGCFPGRDDAVASWPANYLRQEYTLKASYPVARGTAWHVRTAQGWLLLPQSAPPPGGFPAIVAANGHGMSAVSVIDPNDAMGWYGETFARRGYVVFALHVSHRPLGDRARLYTDILGGDQPERGNGPHPAIRADDMDSDWEETGERVADVMRAREFLASLPFVDGSRVAVTGLSMGGELATWAGALDPRLAASIPAGYSPDSEVLRISGNHPCFKWQHGDVHEYVSTVDLLALIAPRPLLIETGARDPVFSTLAPPFSGDLQVARGARLAYGADAEQFVHYLHPDDHRFRAGDADCDGVVLGVTEPIERGPTAADLFTWQRSADTRPVAASVFEWLTGGRSLR